MNDKTIIGREKEQQILQRCLNSEESEFVAITVVGALEKPIW